MAKAILLTVPFPCYSIAKEVIKFFHDEVVTTDEKNVAYPFEVGEKQYIWAAIEWRSIAKNGFKI